MNLSEQILCISKQIILMDRTQPRAKQARREHQKRRAFLLSHMRQLQMDLQQKQIEAINQVIYFDTPLQGIEGF